QGRQSESDNKHEISSHHVDLLCTALDRASRNCPLLTIGYSCWSRGNSVDRRRLSADHLLQCLIDDFEFFALQEQNEGDSAAILQVGNRPQRAEAGGFTKRLLDRLSQRNLRLGHRRALRLGSG